MPAFMRVVDMPVKNVYALSEFASAAEGDRHIAMRLAAILKEKNLTQEDVALRLGVGQPTISRAVNGHPGTRLRTLEAIARAIDCEVGDFFATDRSSAEQALIEAFRSVPPDRQQGWMDMASAIRRTPKE